MKLSGTKTTTEEISVDASNLQNELQLQINDLSKQITELENKKPETNTSLISAISDSLASQETRISELQSKFLTWKNHIDDSDSSDPVIEPSKF